MGAFAELWASAYYRCTVIMILWTGVCGRKRAPDKIAAIAYQNKAVVYDLLFKASAETMLAIAADPKHLGACIGFTSVLHTWGSST
jgi:hypothetical protein